MTEPRVAVVVPIFRRPALAVDALESALRQQASFDFRVVAVNDGCPFAETEQVCRHYARAHPERFLHIRRSHGGPAAARNTGIDLTLRAWPSVEAIQCLDAADRLGPRALQTAYQALRRDPALGWVCPGPWSALGLLANNSLARPGMVRREVFERGLRYDQQAPPGSEDRDFWLRCIGEGLRGAGVPEVEFHRRQRPDGEREHCPFFTPRRAVALEQEEAPRYALYLADTGRLAFTTDPDRPGPSLPAEELAPRLLRADAFPDYFAVTSEAFLQIARAGRFAPGLFWRLQARLEQTDAGLATVHFQTRGQRDACLQVRSGPEVDCTPPDDCALLMLQSRTLRDLLTGRPLPRRDRTAVSWGQPHAPETFPADALHRLAALIEQTAPAYRRLPLLPPPAPTVQPAFPCGPLYPLAPDPDRLHVGFVTPVCEFGGAERVSLNLAREARRHGWAPHLFVIGADTARLLAEFNDVFESITVLERPDLRDPRLLAGLLGTMDVVVNNNCHYMNDALAPLRDLGVRTFTHLHSVTVGPGIAPCGQPFAALRHEPALDGVLVISQKLKHWCRALGIPGEKIVHVPNAPSFEASEATIDTTLAERAGRTSAQPLRVLFSGRFDAEKGMDRLVDLIVESQRRGLPLDWRVVGREVLGQGPNRVDLDPIRPFVRPPALTSSALARLYRWPDVVVMLSRFEGVPLTILEAQRFGCVALSTEVGAVGELVEPGRTGLLFSNDLDNPTLVGRMLDSLLELHHDRARLLEMGQWAVALRRRATWARSFEAFARAVGQLSPRAARRPA